MSQVPGQVPGAVRVRIRPGEDEAPNSVPLVEHDGERHGDLFRQLGCGQPLPPGVVVGILVPSAMVVSFEASILK
jgi:hypothetical protein